MAHNLFFEPLFHGDALSYLITSLVIFVGTVIILFSYRYFEGNQDRSRILCKMVLLCALIITVVYCNNSILFVLFWTASNYLLAHLIGIVHQWPQAQASQTIALYYLMSGSLLLGLALLILWYTHATMTLTSLIYLPSTPITQGVSLLIILAAMIQSALFPFHKWLISSLNAPTPISALMHAGLINGGGILLARFAPLLLQSPLLLQLIALIGTITLLIATIGQLLQSSVKQALTFSTSAQMGCMFLQCGLGLFSSAIAHLCWHGLFKAFLFLSSGAAAQKKSFNPIPLPNRHTMFIAFCIALLSSYSVYLVSGKALLPTDSTFIITIIVFITSLHLSFTALHNANHSLSATIIINLILALLYGVFSSLFNPLLPPLTLYQPQPFTSLYMIIAALLTLAYLLFFINATTILSTPRFYTMMLNFSQPHPATIFSRRIRGI